MKLNRFLPLITPALILALFEFFYFSPKMIYISLVLSNLLIFFSFWHFTRQSTIDKEWWNYATLPSLVTSAVIAYSVFLSSKGIIQLLFIFSVVFLYIYLRHVYYYLLSPTNYEVFSIENLSSYLNFISFFLFASSVYGVQLFLGLPIWPLEIFMLFISGLSFFQMVWVNKIDIKAGMPYILICSLVVLELSWAFSFLPFNFNILGLCLSVCYYVLTGLAKNFLQDKLNEKNVKAYLIFGSISLLLIIITAKWI